MTTKKAQTVAEASATLEALQETRARLVTRTAEIDNERRAAAYQCHVNRDPEARRELDRINQEAATHDSELRSVDDAIATAKAKLSIAKQNEAKAAAGALAKEVRKIVAEFIACAERQDELGAEFNANAAALEELGGWLDRHGFQKPQRPSLCALATHTLMTGLPSQWRRSRLANFRVLGSNERHSFAGFVKEQAANILHNIADNKEEEAA
jgi:hypothetical protein